MKHTTALRWVRHVAEALPMAILLLLFRLVGLHAASAIGGWLGRWVGPILRVNERAVHPNLMRAFPDWSFYQRQQTLRRMWENLGRTAGEFVHIHRLVGSRFARHVEVRGWEHMEEALANEKAMLFFSAHMANWELAPQSAAAKGHKLLSVYRPANNPLTERMIQALRLQTYEAMMQKGKEAARGMVRALKARQAVGMLIDQRLSSGGIPVPFFGHPAPTSPALAELGSKYDALLLPIQVERTRRGPYFRVSIHPPLQTESHNVQDIMQEAHLLLEAWIRARPAQWFWVHHRWGKP